MCVDAERPRKNGTRLLSPADRESRSLIPVAVMRVASDRKPAELKLVGAARLMWASAPPPSGAARRMAISGWRAPSAESLFPERSAACASRERPSFPPRASFVPHRFHHGPPFFRDASASDFSPAPSNAPQYPRNGDGRHRREFVGQFIRTTLEFVVRPDLVHEANPKRLPALRSSSRAGSCREHDHVQRSGSKRGSPAPGRHGTEI